MKGRGEPPASGHDFELRIYVHLICTDDLSSLTVCLNLLTCELAFTYVRIASCNLFAYTFVMCKIQANYLLTYLL